MGYYTNYELKIYEDDSRDVELWIPGGFIEEFEKLTGYYLEAGGVIGDAKWYDHHAHMKQLSINHPEEFFVLTGTGEESGDIWAAYYQNGKSQEVEAVIALQLYDKEKMK